MSFEVSKDTQYFELALCFVFVDQDVRSQLLLQHHPCLPVTVLSSAMVTDLSSETVSHK